MTIREVLTDPDGFFEERATEPSLRAPLLVITVYAIFTALANLPAILLFEINSILILTIVFLLLIVLHLFVASLGLAIFAGITYVISHLFGGSGSFRRMFTLMIWGFLPMIAGQILSMIAVIITVQGKPTIPIQSSVEVTQRFSEIMAQSQAGSIGMIVSLGGLAATLWGVYIWTYAVKHSREISIRQALISAGIPILLVLPFQLL